MAAAADVDFSDNQEKEKKVFFCLWNKEAKMIVLLLGAPIQNPKMIAALKMKSLWFWFFIRFIQQT